MKVRPHRFCGYVLAWCLARIPAEKQDEWWFQMEAPLPGEADRGPSQAQLDREAQDFLEFQKMTGV